MSFDAINEQRRKQIEINKENFLVAFEKKAANISQACKSCGFTRETFLNYVKDDRQFANQVSEIQEAMLDFTESQLMKKISEGDTRAMEILLNAKGRDRGYGNKVDLNFNAPILVKLPEGFE